MLTAKDIHIREIHEIASLVEGNLTQKLAEMGCVPGTQIEKLYTAPGGDPIAFRIDAYILGLRKSEANQILIKENTVNH
jgi:ferrous iron transport protein A